MLIKGTLTLLGTPGTEAPHAQREYINRSVGPGPGRLGVGCVSRSGMTKSLMLQTNTPMARPDSNQAFLGHHVSFYPALPL